MKTLDIAFKDILRAVRSIFFLAFGLGVPILMGGIFYFAFGGLSSGDGGFTIDQIEVVSANLDQPQTAYGDFSAGQMMVDILEENESLFAVRHAKDAASARRAVDNEQAAVAVIIPAGFTAAAFEPGAQAEIEIYQDPTLTLGPNIVKSFISSIVDGFSGSSIAAEVALDQLRAQGIAVNDATQRQIYSAYGDWARALGEGQQTGDATLLAVRSPAGEQEESDEGLSIVGGTMMGMMVFYTFFTGAASAQSILQEEEEGTLPRQFTTPTPMAAILGGKFIAIFVLLVMQVLALVGFSTLVFRTDFGAPLPLAMAVLALVVLAASFGIFITSWLKNTKQAGVVYGGVMTVMGMTGMSSVFTAGGPGATGGLMKTLPLIVPQGWAVHTWRLVMDGASASDILLPFGVMIVLGAVSFMIGILRFRNRFT